MVMPGPGDLFGRYRVVRFIARGGMGSVYEAEDTALRRPVALKVLVPELSQEPEFRARFAGEARVLAGLDSPHVIKLFDHGEHDGQLYFVTQLVRGSDLAQLLEQRGPLPVDLALHLVTQVTSALADAHAARLLHRDVKPSNVLVRESDDDELFAYLIDFGIARTVDSDHTSTGQVVGTVAYMAPERHDGAPASVATDIYSLGCLLWALLDGRSPYADRSGVSLAVAHMQAPLPVYAGPGPATLINQVLARSMAKDPRDRFETAAEMRSALRLVRAAGPDLVRHAAVTVAAAGPTRMPGHTPAPAPLAPPAATPPRTRRWLAPLVAVAAVAAIAGVGAALTLGDDRDDPGTAVQTSDAARGDTTETPTSRRTDDQPSSSRPSTKQSPGSTSGAGRSEAVATDPAQEGSATHPVRPSEAPESAPAPAPPPVLESTFLNVFPTAAGCPVKDPSVEGKVEVRVCRFDGYLVRYSSWRSGAQARFDYLDEENGSSSEPLRLDGVVVGRQWDGDAVADADHYQWSATYGPSFQLPYSVSVESTTSNGEALGVARVLEELLPPKRFGR